MEFNGIADTTRNLVAMAVLSIEVLAVIVILVAILFRHPAIRISFSESRA